MRIGLIDVDGHNFPNIPLMKLSAWHKSIGDSVEWYSPLFSGHMDRVYMSKVFSFTPDYEHFVDADEVIRGGSGYCIETVDGREIYHKEIYDEGGCFDGGRVYFDRNGVDQEGEERANWIDAVWCDGMNRDGLPATWTYETEIPCERFDIWEDGEIYCVGLVFSIEDLK